MNFSRGNRRVLQRIVVISLGCILLSSVLSEGDFVDDASSNPSSDISPIEAPIIPPQEDPLPVIDPPITPPPIIIVEPVYAVQTEWQNWTDLLSYNEPNVSEYTCNPDKTECRVNLLVTPLLDGVVSSDLTCEVTADFELIPTQDPCNPNTSIVPKGDHTISIKILKKSDGTLVTHKDILLKNPLIDTSLDPLRVTSTITWQSPTDLNTKDDTSLAEYICDGQGVECRVNLLVTPLLDGAETSQLTCQITADFEVIPSKSSPCNPNTSLVPPGEHILTIKILQKSDNTLLTTRDIVLKNIPPDTSLDPLRVTSSLVWQSPTYLLAKEDGSLGEYTCDSAQAECKINPLFTPLLDGVETSQLTCEITADFELIPTQDPCNPNTSIVPPGDHILTFKIIRKSDTILLATRQILLKNPPRILSSGGGGGGSAGGASLMDLSTVKMTVQSGLDIDGRCRSDVCQVNFLAETPLNAMCLWDFGAGVFETIGTQAKCNPGYVKFPTDTSVTLTVSDPLYPTNSVTKTMQIFHGQPAIILGSPEARIDIQGVIGKNKRLTNGGILCEIGNDDACSLNFTAENSLNAKFYFWNFGNGATSQKENPPAEKFPLGIHQVVLRVMDTGGASSEIRYTVEVVKKFDILPEKICLDCDTMKGKIQISAVLPNPPHADTVEWIEITNISSEVWDLSSCILSDDTRDFALSGTLSAHKTLRLRQAETGITLGNTTETITLQCGDFLIDTFSWNFPIPNGYILRRSLLDLTPKKVTVLETIDGDTIDVMLDNKKTRIRLLGVDTPETVHPLKSVEKFGKEASDFTKRTLLGKTVWVTFDHQPFDHYGRTLAYIWQCESVFDAEKCTLFNARLISQGYARMERRFAFIYYESFDALEKEAKKNNIGVWSDKEVAQDLEKIGDEEVEKLKLEQEQEYLRLQQELLELQKKRCEEEGVCEDILTWSDITQKMTTLSVRSLASGLMKIGGRTWGDFPLKIQIFLGEQHIYSAEIRTDISGEYALEWYPRSVGQYRIEVTFREQYSGGVSETGLFVLQKDLVVTDISEHFSSSLDGAILVQGSMTKNRWVDDNHVFQCRSRGSCSVNLTAEYNRKKDILYTWTLPNGGSFVGKNPPSFKVGYGDFVIKLSVADTITGENQEKILYIHHSPIPKAPKKTSTKSSKYTLDLKDASLDIGGGVTPEVSSISLNQSLFVLFILFMISFFLFGKEKLTDKINNI